MNARVAVTDDSSLDARNDAASRRLQILARLHLMQTRHGAANSFVSAPATYSCSAALQPKRSDAHDCRTAHHHHVKRLASEAWPALMRGMLDSKTVWNCAAISRL